MGEVVAFLDPQADLEGEELERALAIAREFAGAAAGEGLWHAMKLISRAPGCERLGIDWLLPIASEALLTKIKELNPAA